MMDIRVIPLWLCMLFCLPVLTLGQVTEKEIQEANNKYSKLFASDMLVVSPGNKRGIVTDRNNYGIDRAWLLDLDTGRIEPLETAWSYQFFTDNLLVCQMKDRTVIRDLKNSLTREVKGNYIYIPYSGTGKFALYDRQQKVLMFFDTKLKLLANYRDVDYVSMTKDAEASVFVMAGRIVMINLKTMKSTEWKTVREVRFAEMLNNDVVTIEKDPEGYFINRYSDIAVSSRTLVLPDHFDISNSNNIIIRDERYVIMPVRKETEKEEASLGQIFYSNQNNNRRLPTDQMAVYDLKTDVWKRLPKESDLYSVQEIVDGHSTLIYYDPSSNKMDTIANNSHRVSLEKDFGSGQIEIDNVYVKGNKFHYDEKTDRMIYFKDKSWWVQNIDDGSIVKIPVSNPDDFVAIDYSGLSDTPSGSIYPTNKASSYILTDAYDFFLYQAEANRVTRLTFGREINESYQLADKKFDRITGISNWDVKRNDEIDLDRKYSLVIRNIKSYDSGIAEFDFRTSKMKKLVNMEDAIRSVFLDGQSIVWTSQSFGKPLSVYQMKGNKMKLIYSSKGNEDSGTDIMKKEMIQYEVNGKRYNAALLYPVNFDPNKKYPLIFEVYERQSKDVMNFYVPHLFEGQGFNAMHYIYNGYFVLLPDLDFVEGAVGKSISASVDALVEKLKTNSNINTDKMAVVGSSFGGYETMFLMTQNSWFATGIAGVGIADLPFNAMSYFRNFKTPDYFRVEHHVFRMGKNLFQDYQGYLENSPLYNMKNLTKPVLLWTGQNDGNVNPDQSRAFLLGMKRLGKKGALIEYPNEGHNLSKKENQLDLNVKGWQWLDYHLKDAKPAEWIKPLLD